MAIVRRNVVAGRRRVAMRAEKTMRYGTRRLLAGDEFDAMCDRDARVLEALKKASRLKERAPVYVPPVPPDMPVSEIDRLRDMALSAGLKVDRRFGEARLRELLGL